MNASEMMDHIFGEESLQALEARIRDHARQKWEYVRKDYHENPDDLCYCWHYLSDHPIFNGDLDSGAFMRYLHIDIVKVNPDTLEIDNVKERNIRTNVWLESGPVYLRDDAPEGFIDPEESAALGPLGALPTHDYHLDTGGDTFEEAIIDLASLVSKRYGDDRSRVYRRHDDDGKQEEEEEEEEASDADAGE